MLRKGSCVVIQAKVFRVGGMLYTTVVYLWSIYHYNPQKSGEMRKRDLHFHWRSLDKT